MKKHPQHSDVSDPQSVTEFIKVHNGQETIQIGFTNQRVSPLAGLSVFGTFLHQKQFSKVLAEAMPVRTSPNATPAVDLALGFMTGILAGACKLTHVAHLRRDPLLPGLLGIEGIGSQSTYSRFFQSFKGPEEISERFGPLWDWCINQLPARGKSYTLDLDSTHLLHEDAHQKEGVEMGRTTEGFKRSYHPLLAMISELQLVAGFWLRSGSCRCDNHVVPYTEELLGRLPHWMKLGLVRADSGFCYREWLDLLEKRGLSYIVVGRFYKPVVNLIRKTTRWVSTELPGTEVADETYQGYEWDKPRRVILLRHRLEDRDAGGKTLVDCPGYHHQVLVTNLPGHVPALEVWRRYNPRAASENVIKELAQSFALEQLSLKKFYATEAALSLAVIAYNLNILFQQKLGWSEKLKLQTMRFLIFTVGGVISRKGGYTTIRLSVPPQVRPWWRRVLEKFSTQLSNCHAVEKLKANWPQMHLAWG